MRMLGNFAMNLLHARGHERIHKTKENVFARRCGLSALGGFGSGYAGNSISDGNHFHISFSSSKYGKAVTLLRLIAPQYNSRRRRQYGRPCMVAL
jgi:hypothetical protein